jgi:hypothetical protein
MTDTSEAGLTMLMCSLSHAGNATRSACAPLRAKYLMPSARPLPVALYDAGESASVYFSNVGRLAQCKRVDPLAVPVSAIVAT